jgi:hypothetical protein
MRGTWHINVHSGLHELSNQKLLVMKMKRICLVLLPLAVVFLFVYTGCDKDEDDPGTKNESTNTLVYEDRSLQEKVSPYFYDNHIYRIELVGENHKREQILHAALEKGVDKEFLMIEEAQKFFFNHTEVIMYSIPTLDPEQTLILYETKGLYQVGMARYRPAEQGRMSFTLSTMDDRSYFSLKLDDQNRMGELRVFDNEEVKSFNRTIYSLTLREESREESAKGTAAICCRKESSWSDCMDCTVNDCGGSWLCKIAGIIAPVELVAGFAVSCIGAGNESRC